MKPIERRIAGPGQARKQLRTIRDLLRYACSRFGAAGVSHGHGVDSAYDEAVWLILWSLHLPPDVIDPWLDARLARDEIDAIIDLVDRRCTDRMPLPYLTGEAWLRGLRFRADPRALVPRSPIAEALAESLPDWIASIGRPPTWPRAILDLCTGGGSLAIVAALTYPDARVDAADVSDDALALAAENLADHGLERRIRLLAGDLFGAVGRRRYDLIVCNPPYVNDASMAGLPPEFQREPSIALAGGNDGMDVVRRIVAAAPGYLTRGGLLLVEVGHEADPFEAAFPRLEFAWLPVAAGDRMLAIASREQLEAAR